MDSTQSWILIRILLWILAVVIGIFYILLFGSPIKQKTEVVVTGQMQEAEASQAKQPPASKLELVSRAIG